MRNGACSEIKLVENTRCVCSPLLGAAGAFAGAGVVPLWRQRQRQEEMDVPLF